MKINIEELEKGFQLIFQKIKEGNNFVEIECNHDFYWTIDSNDRLVMAKEPQVIVGSLYDDIDSLRKMNSGIVEPLSESLDWLGNLIIYFGSKIYESEDSF